jgi:hypothetical protein
MAQLPKKNTAKIGVFLAVSVVGSGQTPLKTRRH